MNDLTLAPITEAPFSLLVPVPARWPEQPVFEIPRTPLPEVEEVGWVQWDSAVRWHDSKHSPL